MAESCSGSSAACPADVLLGSETICRATAGDCDVEERCTGSSADCPGDIFLDDTTVCRASGGECDVEETCTGVGAECPADVLAPETTVCRPKEGPCDIEELCTGFGPSCPEDQFQDEGTACTSDTCTAGGLCNGTDDICECQPGICRTPGFWGTHPSETQLLLSDAGQISICGVAVGFYDDCAAEGLCTATRGSKRQTTARHLLATALNCILTSGDYTCGGSATPLGQLFAACNEACVTTNVDAMIACYPQLDCYNNGGRWVNGKCALGSCSATPELLCGDRLPPCPTGADATNHCEPFADNCHDQPLDGGIVLLPEPPAPADPQICQESTSSSETFFTDGVCPQ